MIRIENVSKKQKKNSILKNVSFTCKKGEITCMVGNNGVGKTTLIKIICGLLDADSGHVYINNKNIKENYIGYMNEIGETICLNAGYNNWNAIKMLRYVACLKGVKDDRLINELINEFNLDKKKKIEAYSLGMKARLNIAMALIASPNVIILDEPFNGIDPGGVKALNNKIVNLAKQEGKTILLSSHNLHGLSEIADKAIIFDKGIVVKELRKKEIKDNQLEKKFFDFVKE